MAKTIVHLLEKPYPNGCHTMLSHLYIAIDKYHPEYKQKVVLMQDIDTELSYEGGTTYIHKKELAKVLKTWENPVVINHRILRSRTQEMSKLLFGKFPFIVLCHTYTQYPNPVGKCDAFVCVSEHMRAKYFKKMPDINYVFIRNGVNQFMYDEVDIERGYTPNLKKYFLAGRINMLNTYKHRIEFIKWCSNQKFDKKMYFEYIGAGNGYSDARRLLKTKAYRESRNKVILCGSIYDFQTKISMLKSWKVFIYDVIKHEGSSMSVLESLACGVPVVASKHYGTREFVKKGVNGTVYDNIKNARGFINKMISDKRFCKEMKAQTHKHFAENLDARHTAKKYIELIEDIA